MKMASEMDFQCGENENVAYPQIENKRSKQLMQRCLELEKKVSDLETENQELKVLISSIPGGVCEVVMDNCFTLLYGNEGFYSMYGYTAEQMQEERKSLLVNIIYPEDLAEVTQAIDHAYEAYQNDPVNCRGFVSEHRACHRDGRIVWVTVRGNFLMQREQPILNCVVIDITDRKNVEQELRINEERFRIALEQTDNTIFDYDIKSRIMIHGDKSGEQYGISRYTENVPDSLVEEGIIHPDTTAVFLDMYNQIRSGAKGASCRIRTRLIEGGYAWRRISMTTIFDGDGRPVRAVGILEDIDEQMQREQQLRDKSERDALTGLYNRGATEAGIDSALGTREPEQLAALFIIDIDHFKNVNDQYGHQFGDYVLKESARRISQLFRHEDVIGRIGGDEFIVYMVSALDSDAVIQRAEQLRAAFQGSVEMGPCSMKVTCSIGIVLCPQDGRFFNELYRRADIALYEAKRRGKNQYVAYRPDLHSDEDWIPYSNTAIDGITILPPRCAEG